MPIRKRDLQKSLIQKFGFEEVAGSRHEALSLFVGGRKVATVRFSRSHQDIGDTILRLIARECWVTLGYLQEMHRCTKSRDEYLEWLRQNNYLE